MGGLFGLSEVPREEMPHGVRCEHCAMFATCYLKMPLEDVEMIRART
jgi:hypothetical protein